MLPAAAGHDESNYVVNASATPDTRTGSGVLRGNVWELEDPTAQDPVPAVDPVAAAGGVTIYGTKTPGLAIALADLGVPQIPPEDPGAAVTDRGEIYVSFWLW